MGLRIKSRSLAALRPVVTLMMVFALVAQPMYGFVASQVANATAVTSHVVINEIAPATSTNEKWIELYNPTSEAVDMSGWRFALSSSTNPLSPVFAANTTIAPGGFYVYTPSSLTPDGRTLELRTASSNYSVIDTVTYPQMINGQSYARTVDAGTQFEVRGEGQLTKGTSNTTTQAPAPQPPAMPILDIVAATCEAPVNMATFTGVREDVRLEVATHRIEAEKIPAGEFDIAQALAANGIAVQYGSLVGEWVWYDRNGAKIDIKLGDFAAQLVDPETLECGDEGEEVPVRPVVTSVTPSETSYLTSETQRIDINVENIDDVRGGYLQLNKAIAGDRPANSTRTNYQFQKDDSGWFAIVDTTNIIKGAGTSNPGPSGSHQGDGNYLFKVEAYGYGTPHGYYGNGSSWASSEHYFTVDNTDPKITIKDNYVGNKDVGIFSQVSFSLSDNIMADKYVINGVERDFTNSRYSDANFQNIRSHLRQGGDNTITLYDVAGNSTSYTFVYDSVAPEVTEIAQVYETREGGRIGVTLTFSERINSSSLGQGWYEVTGSDGTQFVKRYYRTQDQTVAFRDIAGNTGSYEFTVDKSAPVLTVNGSTESGRYFGPGRVGIEASDGDLDRIVTEQKHENGEFVHRHTYEKGRNFTNTANVAWLGDGVYRMQAFDTVGNPSAVIEFTIDTTRPTLHLPDVSMVRGEQIFTISQTEANPDRTYVEYMRKDGNGDYRKVHGQWFNDANTFNYNVDTTQWGDGEYQVKISTWDKANNHSGANFQFIVDNTAPVTSINVQSPNGTGDVHRDTVRVTGVVDPSEQNIKSHWFEIRNPDGTLSYSYNMNTNSLEYSFDLDTSKGDGDYQIRYVATDRASNRNDIHGSTVRTITVDNTAPQVTIAVSEDGRSFSGASIDAGVGERDYVTINFYLLDANGNAVRDENGNQISRHSVRATVDENGDWSYRISDEDLSKFTVGERYRVNVRAWDAIGNNEAIAQGYVFNFAVAGHDDDAQQGGGDESDGSGAGTSGGQTNTTGGTTGSAPAPSQTLVTSVAQPTSTAPVLLGAATPLATTAAPATAATPAAAAAVLGDQDVLGTSDTAAPSATANDDAEADDETDTSGLAWYWWLLIALVGIGAAWWIIAALRRHIGEDE